MGDIGVWEGPDLYIMLSKFRNSEATDPRDKIYALLGISSDTCGTGLLKADYGKDLQDVVFNTASFLLNLNELNTRRFFDWTLPEFLGKLEKLPVEVLKCAMNTGHEWAVQEGHEAVVKVLLERGAALETRDYWGRTPLLHAARYGHEAVIKVLLERGVELKTKDNDSRTPLSHAAGNGHEAVVKVLLERGAELKTRDNDSRTPLLWAARYGHEAVVKVLLERGAALETEDYWSRTPLLHAVGNGHEAVVKLLLERRGARD